MITTETIIDGDFASDEVTRLRDEADIICTNPPFSLFRDFLAWINPDEKKFLILGTIGAVAYKAVFPLIRDNKLWLGASIHSGDVPFYIPDHYVASESIKVGEGNKRYVRVPGVRWFTNLNHRVRREELLLLTKAEREYQGVVYQKYDNYDAIEVPETKLIPSDYDGVMGVPVSFLDKYNPDQFELLGITQRNDDPYRLFKYTAEQYTNANDLNAGATIKVNGIPQSVYARILIKNK